MMPTADTATPALTGAALDTFLNRLDADLEEAESGDAIQLAERLRAQPLQPDSIEAIERLYRLWINADDAAAAFAVLDLDGARVRDAAAPDARGDIRMRIELCRLRIGQFRQDEALSCRAIAALCAIVGEETQLDPARYRQLRLYESVESTQPGAALDLAELQYALAQASPDRAAFRAWDQADRERRRAQALRRLGRADEARAAGEAAVAALAAAGADQDVDENDWFWIGESVIDVAPAVLGAIAPAVTAQVADWPLARRREAEVRLARLSAREARALGDLDSALARCEAARYALGDGNSDDFTEFELPWLMQAGRYEEAGRRAFLHLYDQETSSQGGALRIVHERLADPGDTLIWWPLCALRACNLLSTLEHFIDCGRGQDGEIVTRSPLHAQLFAAAGKLEGDALREAVFDAACAVLEQRAPGHPWFVRVASPLAGEFGRIDATTEAARLLSAIEQGGLNDRRSAYSLLNARRRSLGVERAMALPPPAPDGGYDCYALGCTLDDNDPWYEDIERLPGEDGSRVGFRQLRSLKARIYEHGRMQMERFAETGRGHPGDAGAHLYSMLCNNLAIIYRFDEKRYDDAIELHERGIAVSPFAEHYQGILNCRIGQGDHEATVAAGEQLWHFANEFGYSRHDVNQQCGEMLRALEQLGRHSEKLIWLQRLIEWQRENDEVDTRLSTDALCARLDCAFYLTGPYSEQAQALWTSLREQVEASDEPKVLSIAGDYLRVCGDKPGAQRFYARLLEVNPHSPNPILFDEDSISRLLAKMDESAERNKPAEAAASAASGKRAWWKFWQ